MSEEEQVKRRERQEVELESLRKQVVEASALIEHVQGQLAKESQNSSHPPSSNGFKEPVHKTQSLRGKSERTRGGQPGHHGHPMQQVEHPEPIVRLSPSHCEHGQQELIQAPTTRVIPSQVWDLPVIRFQVTQYQAEVKICPRCQHETHGVLPDGIKAQPSQSGPNVTALAVSLSCIPFLPFARVSQLLPDVLGTSFSQASVLAACRESAQALRPRLSPIKAAFQQRAVIHTDETGFRVEKKRGGLHLASTPWYPLSLPHPKRSSEATNAMGILPGYQGVRVHDTLALSLSSPCTHAFCVAHSVRERTFLHEHFPQNWARHRHILLRSIFLLGEHTRAAGTHLLTEPDQQGSRQRSRDLILRGLAANPPPPQRTGERGAIKQGDGLHCLLRFQQ